MVEWCLFKGESVFEELGNVNICTAVKNTCMVCHLALKVHLQ